MLWLYHKRWKIRSSGERSGKYKKIFKYYLAGNDLIKSADFAGLKKTAQV